MVARNSEVAWISDFVQRSAGGGAGLVIEGEPGIGKTTLWRREVARARAGVRHVLVCRPAEAETSLGLTALVDLLGDVVDEALLARLPEPQARAVSVALLRHEAGGAAVNQGTMSRGVLEMLRMLSADRPVLIAIDDLHWLDPGSARVLGYVLRRLENEPVTVLATRRTPLPAGTDGVGLERWLSSDLVSHLRLGPLSLGALHQLVGQRLGIALTHPLAARLTRASGGNPFYALEIARMLGEQGGDLSAPGLSLAIPADLHAMVASRLDRLPRQAREALLATFALARPTQDLVEQSLELAGLAPDGVELARRAQTLAPGADRLELAHPLLGSAAYAQLTAMERRELHGRLAQLPVENEEKAQHLGLSIAGADAEVAIVLDEAAAHATRRGAPDTAAGLIQLAVTLTPGADPDGRIRRLDQLALAHHLAGDSERAVMLWREIERTARRGPLRAHAVWRLAEYGSSSVDGGFEGAPGQLQSILDEAASDRRLQVDIEASTSEFLTWSRGPGIAGSHARRALELAEQCDDRQALMHALISRALTAFFSGEDDPTAFLERAESLQALGTEVPAEVRPSAYGAYFIAWRGDSLGAATRRLEGELAVAQQEGDESSLPMLLWQCCEVAVARGRLDAASVYALRCRAAVDASGRAGRRGASIYCQALVEGHRGRVDEARSLALEALALDEPRGVLYLVARYRGLLGFLEISSGRPEEALRWMEPAHHALLEEGHREPAMFRFVPDEVEALVTLGRADDAHALLEPYRRSAVKLGRRSAIADAARASALLRAARGDIDAALGEVGEAANLERDLGRPFHQARALMTAGAIARRARRKATADDALTRAAELFDQLGAPLWAKRATDERMRVGLGRAAPAALTETERRIAVLIAEGRSNPEIARALFMSRKTVEAHLTSIYRKTGTTTRAELAARAAEHPEM